MIMIMNVMIVVMVMIMALMMPIKDSTTLIIHCERELILYSDGECFINIFV